MSNKHRRHSTWLHFAAGLGVALTVGAPAPAATPSYPERPVRIVASGIGGGNDLVARLVAQGLGPALGQQVIVENRGGGVAAAEIVARAQPDGYTLLLYGSTLWLSPFMRDTSSYDPVRDYAPIILATRAPNVLMVHPSVPATSVAELIALAKAKPNTLNYASAATGASNHLAGELFNAMAGVKITRVPYKGIGPAINDLLGGYVQMSLNGYARCRIFHWEKRYSGSIFITEANDRDAAAYEHAAKLQRLACLRHIPGKRACPVCSLTRNL